MLRRLLRWTLVAAALAGLVALVRNLRGRLPGMTPPLPADYKLDLLNPVVAPRFPDQQGAYEDPGLIIPGGEVPSALPPSVPCPGSLVIYASWIELVANCAGYQGAGAGQNPVAQTAAAIANAVAARIPCAEGCEKRVTEIWRGWECGNNPLSAVAAVEVKLTCEVSA